MHVAIKLLISVYILSIVGCGSMCNTTPDCEFHAYGGMRDRHDRVNGRVGSLFAPAAADPSIVPPEEFLPPLDVDSPDDPDDVPPGSDDGSVEESELGKKLIDELDKLDDLPEVDPPKSGSGSEPDAEGGFET